MCIPHTVPLNKWNNEKWLVDKLFSHIDVHTHTQRSLWWQFYCVWFSHAELCGPLPRAAHRGCDPETHDPDRMCHDHDVTVSSNHWCFWWWWWWFQAYMSSHGFAPTSVLTVNPCGWLLGLTFVVLNWNTQLCLCRQVVFLWAYGI